jgi:hypothetical protein
MEWLPGRFRGCCHGGHLSHTAKGVPQSIEVLAQRERIDLLDPHAQLLLLLFWQDIRGEHLLQGRLGCAIHAAYPVIQEHFRLEFERGLKAVDDQTQHTVDFVKVFIRWRSL